MTNFDSLCDKSAPGMFVDIDAMWRATMDVATSRAPAAAAPVDLPFSGQVGVCPRCEGGGFYAELYPSGHTEMTCEECGGSGTVE